jgi:alpha-1,2-mannosyltransferase
MPAPRRLLVGLGLVLATLAVYLGTMPTGGSTNDVESAEVAGWRIATTGSASLDGLDLHRLGGLSDGAADRLWVTESATGHRVVSRSPGVMVAAVPAYWLVARVSGGGADPGGFSLVPGQVTAVLLTVTALLLLRLALVGLVGTATRTLAVAVLGFATPVWTVAAGGLYPHSLDLVGIGGMAWAARRQRWWLLGVFGGIALWGRLHLALVVAILGLVMAVVQRRPRIAVEVGVPSTAFLVLASWFDHAVYGGYSPAGGYGGAGHYATAAAHGGVLHRLEVYAGLLVAPDRGLLVWTPALVLLGAALWRAWPSAPVWTRALAVAGVAYLGVQGLLNDFTGGSGYFGYRLSLETLACAFPLLVLAATRLGPVATALLGPLLGLQAGAFAIGAISHGFHVLEQDAWHDNSIWLAVRTFPSIGAFLALTTLVGHLAGRVWRERGIDAGAGSDAGPGTGPGAVLSAAPAAAAASAPAGHRSVPRRGRPPGRR